MICHFIFYVSDQKKSSAFYSKILKQLPSLDVPGMTEFKLTENCILGLMPSEGIKKVLGDTIIDPESAAGIPRAELYLRVPDPENSFAVAVSVGGKLLSPVLNRNWGAKAGYFADPDGHIIAFSD